MLKTYEPTHDIQATIQVTTRDMHDLVVTGIESGGYGSFEIVAGDWRAAWEAADSETVDPFGEIKISDKYGDDPDVVTALDDAALVKGLEVLAAKYPLCFADFSNDNSDALTGDVFLQCVVFGEVIYG